MSADPPRTIIYTRVSTEEQAGTGLGLDAQRKRCEGYVEAQEWVPYEVVAEPAVSGTIAPHKRPVLGAVLKRLDKGDADTLVMVSVSRLARDTIQVLEIARRAADNGWRLVTLDMGGIDASTAAGGFTLTVLAAVAQLEVRQTSERTRAALAALKARGVRLGRPVSPATRDAGLRAIELRADGMTWREVADALNAEGFPTANSGRWHPHSAQRACQYASSEQEAADV